MRRPKGTIRLPSEALHLTATKEPTRWYNARCHPLRRSPTPQPILIPRSLDALGGPLVEAIAEVHPLKDSRGLATVLTLSEPVSWLEAPEAVCVQLMKDGYSLRAIRIAAREDYRHFRVPVWIQDDQVPLCCDRPMAFVGQIDDDKLCTEPPEDARLWWHDDASFYVFTCGQCLAVKAVGQQF